MLKQRFRLYRDLVDKEPRFKRMAPVAVFMHALAVAIALGMVYWTNGTIWTLGGGGGGGGGEMTVVVAAAGGRPEPPAPKPKPEPPKPKPEPPKPEPPKEKPKPEPVEKKEEPKPSVDPDAVKTPVKEEVKEPKKEEKKEEPKKPDPPKEKPKPEPPKPEPKPVAKKEPTPKPKTMVAKNTTGEGTGSVAAAGLGKNGTGPGPAGPSNLPPGLAGWGRTLQMKVERLWVIPGGLAMSPENYADIEFTVDRAGNVLGEPRIVKAALDPAVDLSGINAIKTAKKMPPFPDSYTGQQITVMYRFSLMQ